MKNKKRDINDPARKLVDWGYQTKSLRYDISHERFVVPWQMDHDKKKEIPVS